MLYELKKYEAQPGKFEALKTRFIDKTIPIFNRLGIKVLHCWVPIDEGDFLYYLTSFPDEASRKAAWSAFSTDTEWLTVKANSEAGGALLKTQLSVTLGSVHISPEPKLPS